MTSLPSAVRVIPEDTAGNVLCVEATRRAFGGPVAEAEVLSATRGAPEGDTMKYEPTWRCGVVGKFKEPERAC